MRASLGEMHDQNVRSAEGAHVSPLKSPGFTGRWKALRASRRSIGRARWAIGATLRRQAREKARRFVQIIRGP